MTGHSAVLQAVMDLGSLDLREDFACAVMEGTDRAAFRLVGLKPVNCCNASPQYGKPPNSPGPQPNNPGTKIMYFDLIGAFSNSQFALRRHPQIRVATGAILPPFDFPCNTGRLLLQLDG